MLPLAPPRWGKSAMPLSYDPLSCHCAEPAHPSSLDVLFCSLCCLCFTDYCRSIASFCVAVKAVLTNFHPFFGKWNLCVASLCSSLPRLKQAELVASRAAPGICMAAEKGGRAAIKP